MEKGHETLSAEFHSCQPKNAVSRFAIASILAMGTACGAAKKEPNMPQVTEPSDSRTTVHKKPEYCREHKIIGGESGENYTRVVMESCGRRYVIESRTIPTVSTVTSSQSVSAISGTQSSVVVESQRSGVAVTSKRSVSDTTSEQSESTVETEKTSEDEVKNE